MTVTIKYQAQVCCGSVVPGKGNYGGVCLGPENKTKKTVIIKLFFKSNYYYVTN